MILMEPRGYVGSVVVFTYIKEIRVLEEILEEDEMNITEKQPDIRAATVMTQTLNVPSKRSKNRRDVKFWKIGMQKQTSSWRKELSIIT